MSANLIFSWSKPDHPNYICWKRTFDQTNENALVCLEVPWVQWPNHPLDDAGSSWRMIREKARNAVEDWLVVLERNLSGEAYSHHMRITCMVQLNQQLRQTVDKLGDGEEHEMLFYGFAADEVAKLPEMESLNLGSKVIKIRGKGRDAEAIIRKCDFPE
ncbi:hypothetical protein FALBO_11789 [Fusarium albosuccineum]|uniref:Uncharacterized protein n=1 Tax=Fusarium albosuccineum TaxID=1237068 RepID=A0A8H4P9S1_9HYPO|nr:hypothetical protein FALBO_11789 [Fusarium albosuccineum]